MNHKTTSQINPPTRSKVSHQNISLPTIALVRNVNPKDFGGAEKYQLELAKLLKKHQLNPIIITSSIKLQQEAKTANIRVIHAPYCKKQNWSGLSNFLLPVIFSGKFFLPFGIS